MQKLSRTKIDLFLNCPRCFWLDQVKGVKRPSFPAFTLNTAVDELLKREFDIHRSQGVAHPLMIKYGIDAVPYQHPDLDKWRHNFTGVRTLHEPTGLTIFGAVDDVWVKPDKNLHVVDYKATSKAGEVELGDSKWHNQYRRQMEIYQWLLRQNGFPVSDTGYFVYVNGRRDLKAFDAKLEFDVKIIPYKGSDAWVDGAITKAAACLKRTAPPASAVECEYCLYRDAGNRFEA